MAFKKYKPLGLIIFFTLLHSQFNAKDYVDPSEYIDSDEDYNSLSLLPVLILGGIIYLAAGMFKFFGTAKGKISDLEKGAVFMSSLSILFLFFSYFKLVYGFYTILRYVIFISSIVCLYDEFKYKKENHWKIYFIGILVLYNPIEPVHLNYKIIWMIINFIVGMIFGAKIGTIIEKAKSIN